MFERDFWWHRHGSIRWSTLEIYTVRRWQWHLPEEIAKALRERVA